MPIWKFTTKMKRNCNGVFIEKGMTVAVVTPTTSNPSTILRDVIRLPPLS